MGEISKLILTIYKYEYGARLKKLFLDIFAIIHEQSGELLMSFVAFLNVNYSAFDILSAFRAGAGLSGEKKREETACTDQLSSAGRGETLYHPPGGEVFEGHDRTSSQARRERAVDAFGKRQAIRFHQNRVR